MRRSLAQTETSSKAVWTPISTSGWRNSTGKLFHSRPLASNRETPVAKARSCKRNDTSVDVRSYIT